MNKKQLAQKLAKKTGLTNVKAMEVVRLRAWPSSFID